MQIPTLLVINANPNEKSFCEAIALKYIEKYQTNFEKVELFEMKKFVDTQNRAFLIDEIVIKNFQEKLINCDELVIITPNWWSGIPAIFKYLLEVSLTYDFAYTYKNNLPKGLLTIKKAKIIITQDSPLWYTKCFLGDPLYRMLKKGVLQFCGIKKIEKIVFGNVRNSSMTQRIKWLESI